MSDGSSIEWCDATWTIAVGCTRVSKGCDHCYAATFVHRGLHDTHRGLTKLRPKDAPRPGVDWNGLVRTLTERLADPLRWRKPRRVFVGSMTDLFHPAIPFEYVAAVFGVMAACPQHTFLVLTKRPERAREFFAGAWCRSGWTARDEVAEAAAEQSWIKAGSHVAWPLRNVQLGTSVEDPDTARARIPELMQCPAALRWVSYEPALEGVDFTSGGWLCCGANDRGGPHIDWIVVGGESGPHARPFNVDWARRLLRDADGTGCKVFVKQLGARPICIRCDGSGRGDGPGGYCWGCGGATNASQPLHDRKGGDMSEWPSDLRVREIP